MKMSFFLDLYPDQRNCYRVGERSDSVNTNYIQNYIQPKSYSGFGYYLDITHFEGPKW